VAKKREEKVPKIAIRELVAVAAAAVLASLSGIAGAAELNVMSATEMQAALQELASAFEKKSGHKLKIEYGTNAQVEDKVGKDTELDVAILNKAQADKLVSKAKLVGGSAVTLGKMNPDLIFVAASPAVSDQPLPAKAFVDFLATPEAKAVLKAKGIEPG
jgi:ABC-type molybdate transport system substrate-binding protein